MVNEVFQIELQATFISKLLNCCYLFIYLSIFLHIYSYKKTLRRALQIWNAKQRCVYNQP